MISHPVGQQKAQGWLRQAISKGQYIISDHAEEEMEECGMDTLTLLDVLRYGKLREWRKVDDEYRYKFCTGDDCVVVVFKSERFFRVVTAWGA